MPAAGGFFLFFEMLRAFAHSEFKEFSRSNMLKFKDFTIFSRSFADIPGPF